MSNPPLESWSRELASLDAGQRLTWAATRFAGRLVFASSLGAEDQVITHLIATESLEIPIFTLDTGRLFEETYTLLDRTQRHYGLRIRVYTPERQAVESMVAEHGINLFRDSVEKRQLCCRHRKLEPLRRALAGQAAWICGLRRDQAVTRTAIGLVDPDPANGLIKINPLADWDEARLWQFITDHQVPINPLHDQGFASIGCACCTRAITREEPVRAGRWWWENPEHKECGLHRAGEENQKR